MTTATTRTCPQCGVENPLSRVTCEVCGAKMLRKPTKDVKENEPEDKAATKNPPAGKSEKADVKTKPDKTEETKPDKTEELIDKLKKETGTQRKEAQGPPTKPPAKKKPRRRKVKAATEPTFFVVEDGRLCPVSIKTSVKPLQTKDVDVTAQRIMAVWNRNKGLFLNQ